MRKFSLIFIIITLAVFGTHIAQAKTLDFVKQPQLPYFESPNIMIDAYEQNTLIMRIKSSKSGTAYLFWASSYNPQINHAQSIWFHIKQGTHTYYINAASQHQAWLGWIRKIIILPQIEGGNTTILSAKIESASLFKTAISGWQEFWGPTGRLTIGSTINTMKSPVLYGQSIYSYLYWLIGLTILLAIGWEIKHHSKDFKFDLSLQRISKVVVIALMTLWFGLALSSFYSNWLNSKNDFKYAGKSLDAKKTIYNQADYYPFIQFCQKHLPLEANFDFQVTGVYNDIKTKYYLYPRKHQENAQFLIVYNSKLDKNNYLLWKQFSPKAAIYKRKQK